MCEKTLLTKYPMPLGMQHHRRTAHATTCMATRCPCATGRLTNVAQLSLPRSFLLIRSAFANTLSFALSASLIMHAALGPCTYVSKPKRSSVRAGFNTTMMLMLVRTCDTPKPPACAITDAIV